MGDDHKLSSQLMTPAVRVIWDNLSLLERFEANIAFESWMRDPLCFSAYRTFRGDTGRHVLRCHIVTVHLVEFHFASLHNGLAVLYGIFFPDQDSVWATVD